MATQGRLRGLLRASQMVTRDLALPAVLRRIVEAARELVGARYAALGVISPTGGLAEFVHTGMPRGRGGRGSATCREGKGLLGALIEDPRPIRLRRIASDPRSVGFPPGHPPMSSFLGVPIRIRDEVFGNLYLSREHQGRVQRRGRGAGPGARGHGGGGDRERPAVRVGHVPRRVAAGRRGDHPRRAVGRAGRRRLAGAHRPDQPADRRGPTSSPSCCPAARRSCVIEVAVGTGADGLAGTRVPMTGTLSGQVFSHRNPAAPVDRRTPAPGPRAGPRPRARCWPCRCTGRRRMHGVLWAARRQGRLGVRGRGGRDGGRLRQPGRAGDRARRGPGRAAAGGHARRARADRGRPARPRDPAAVRGRAVAAERGRHASGAGEADRPDPGHGRRPRRHDPADPDQHLPAAAASADAGARAAGAAARRGDRPDPGARLRTGGPVLRRDRRGRRRRRRGRARGGPRVAEQRRPARAGRGPPRSTWPRRPTG